MLKNITKIALIVALIGLPLYAQPVVAKGGIVNAASYALNGLPNSSIAQGSMFIVFGAGLGQTSDLSALKFPLPTTQGLLGTSIKVAVGGSTVDAIMIYTTPTQVAAVLPSATPIGAGTLTLTYNGQSSSTDIQVVKSSLGTFTINSAGSGPSIIQNFVTSLSTPLNTALSPARSGQVEILWGTGLAPVAGDEAAAPLPGDMAAALGVEVWVGNKQAKVIYAGRSGCCVGIDQIVFETPADVQGCYVSVAVKAGGIVSNFTSMAIAPSSSPVCADANGPAPTDLAPVLTTGTLRLGVVNISKTSLKIDAGALGTIQGNADIATAQFGSVSRQQLIGSLGLSQSPSVGSCAVGVFRGLDPTPVDPILPAFLDAGDSLSISGPAGVKTVPRVTTGVYASTLGGVPLGSLLTASNPLPLYLNPGTYTITNGTGGAVGPFSAQVTLPTPLQWTNSPAITDVSRGSDLTITWTGGDANGFAAISGISVVSSGSLGPSTTSPGAAFLCIAPASAGTFTVPSVVLQALPPTTTGSLIPTGFLLFGSAGVPQKFTAPNLDAGYVTFRTLSGGNVNYH